MAADIVFVNGTVIPIDPAVAAARPEAVAVHGNTVSAVGTNAEMRSLAGPTTRVVDLSGRALLPGINDNHTHPMSYGESLGQIDATPDAAPTLGHLQRAFAAARESGGVGRRGDWLLGRGYDDIRLDVQRHPTRWDLDQATGDRPALLVRTCGHLAVANSAALRLAGIDDSRLDPTGGQIDRNDAGEPTGVLRERAIALVREHIPAPTKAEIKTNLRAAGARFLRYGITSVGEASIRTSTEFAAYEELARDGELPMRTFTMMLIDDTLDALASVGLMTGFGDARLRIGPAKLFQDGSGGGRTAAMSTDYRNDPGNRGITIYDQEGLDERFARAHAAGFQLAAHAIGDRAIKMIVTAYERAHARIPRTDTRPRIEHCGLCTPELLDRMVKLGAVAIPQPAFAYYLGDSYIRNFSAEQLALAYPARAWIDRGIVAAGSSDVPVVPCDPWINIRAAVTRGTRDGQVMGPEQKVTIDEALVMFTQNGAYCSFEENLKGSITPGKLADLIVVDRDPRTVAPMDLNTIRTEMTILDGRIVYEA
jgi:predicted amidohydrolase YtcJ